MGTHRLEAIDTETFITSFAVSTALGADAELLTFIDVLTGIFVRSARFEPGSAGADKASTA